MSNNIVETGVLGNLTQKSSDTLDALASRIVMGATLRTNDMLELKVVDPAGQTRSLFVTKSARVSGLDDGTVHIAYGIQDREIVVLVTPNGSVLYHRGDRLPKLH